MTKEEALLQYLQRVDLDLTGLCNRQCSFCPRNANAVPAYPNINKHMSFETLDIVLNELRKIKFKGVLELAGRGESTLHKNFDEVVKRCSVNKTWTLRLTTNGYKIDKWWNELSPYFDKLILNSYDSEDEYEERKIKYERLPNGYYVEHHHKPDGLSIEAINKLPPHRQKLSKVYFSYTFNNRAGYFNDKVRDIPCWHPMRQIFVDYEGDYQMCCNDWLHKIVIGNVHERSLIDMYCHDPKLHTIRDHLLNSRRSEILPCSKCDDRQGISKESTKIMEFFRGTKLYNEYMCSVVKKEGHLYSEDLKKGI